MPARDLEDQIARSVGASRPGAGHRSLEPLVGSWNVDRRWLGTGAETRTSETSENRFTDEPPPGTNLEAMDPLEWLARLTES